MLSDFCYGILVLSAGAAIILSSTVSPAYVSQLDQRLQGMLNMAFPTLKVMEVARFLIFILCHAALNSYAS